MTNLIENLGKTRLTAKIYKNLPGGPGVYIFLQESTPIYIGKAKNLKRRIGSYFDIDLQGKTARMIASATELAHIKVGSELEALLLEAKLIRIYMPKYNVAAKDDKHPLYIQTTKEKYPRVITARKLAENQKNIAFFGPFPSSGNVRSVLSMLRKIFPFADHKLGKRPCLYSHIGLCKPCPNMIEQLTSNKQQLTLRKQYLKNIRRINAVLSGKFDGVKKELFKEMSSLSKMQKFEEAKVLRDQIGRLEYITKPQMPADYYIENPNLYEDQRQMEIKNLKTVLKKNHFPTPKLRRIECFDIAHLAGASPTASMVTFIDGTPEKEFYRHFRIHQKKGNSDIDSLKEVIQRRIGHWASWGKPDLIIVDGGAGQVNAFTSVLGINEINIPVVGIAKNPDRLIIGKNKVKLQGAALQLVTRMRDEAHRFARRYHHKLISSEFK